MFRLIAVLSLLAPGLPASTLSDVNRECIAANTAESSNDLLLGKWYRVYEFIHSSLISSTFCPLLTFTKPTEWELQSYRDRYDSAGFPFTLDENPILLNEDDYLHAMYLGHTEAKFYVLTPNTTMTINAEGYEVNIFRPINENYILHWRCALRGFNRWLLGRDRNAPQEEMRQVIASIPDVSGLFARRYCAPIIMDYTSFNVMKKNPNC